MTVDSKVVDRELKAHLWPALTGAGFAARTGRTTWRARDGVVDVVTIESFNTYLADRMGATTFSFSVRLGVFLDAIATRSRMTRFVRDRARPREVDCHLRRTLAKTLDQGSATLAAAFGEAPPKPAYGRWVDRPDVWYVLPSGTNLPSVVHDACERVLLDGLPWLERMSDPREVVDVLRHQPDRYGPPGIVLEDRGGALGSPARWQKLGAIAVALGDRGLLLEAVEAMSRQEYWVRWPEDLETLRSALATLG